MNSTQLYLVPHVRHKDVAHLSPNIKILPFLILLFASELNLLPVFPAYAVNQQSFLKIVSYFFSEYCVNFAVSLLCMSFPSEKVNKI